MGYKRLDNEDLLISVDSVSSTVWSNNTPQLTAFYTSSLQAISNVGKYYLNVYNLSTSNSSSEVQFSIAYCDKEGKGSEYYNVLVSGSSFSKTNYKQIKNLVLGEDSQDFVFGNYTSPNFYNINIERARYKEKLLAGSLSLSLSGSGGQINLTDDSLVNSSITFTEAGRVYNLVSGSQGVVNTSINSNGWSGGPLSSSGSYGWFLPDVGLILLNPAALVPNLADGGIGLTTDRNDNQNDNNPEKIFNSLNNAGSNNGRFLINSQESISSNFIFVRARNSEFNYSENPSFISGSTGEVLYDTFVDSPRSYITTVGLYNDNNELLAVSKLSRPLQKDFTKELLLRVKLDF